MEVSKDVTARYFGFQTDMFGMLWKAHDWAQSSPKFDETASFVIDNFNQKGPPKFLFLLFLFDSACSIPFPSVCIII